MLIPIAMLAASARSALPPQQTVAPAAPSRRTDWLGRAATFCYLSIAAGQLLFTAFILLFYYPSSLSGDFAAWNSKPLIKGFVAGDTGGNLFFAAHVLTSNVIPLELVF